MATLDERVSRIEGVIDQMNERLGNLEHGQRALDDKVTDTERSLRTEMRSNFRWTLGITIAMWVTIMGAIIGTLLAS